MNLISLETVSKSYGPRPLLQEVSLGVHDDDRIGVVGRNGGGKSTLISLLTKRIEPDAGRVTHARGLRLGYLAQRDEFARDATVASVVLGDRPEHEWAGDTRIRDILSGLLADVPLQAPLAGMSGGERRRVALAALLVPDTDLLVLDEPTNHLDIEAIDWLARHLKARRGALVVVTHDRWFLDEVTERTWEVVDGRVERYEGGYSAYVLAKAERARLAAAAEAKRQNLLRKELAWLRRGPPARTSKPKFRIQAANELIATEPPPRDSVVLQRFATSRLGKDVFDLHGVRLEVGEPPRVVLDNIDWSIGPGDRIGLVGVNGTGKTSVLRMLAGQLQPTAGTVKRGATLKIGYLSQALDELDGSDRVLDAVENRRRITELAGGREISAATLLEDFGFTGDKLTTRIADLSGGERRRLQFLRLLLDEPNVLLLDEPTNDLDIDTLTVIEDYLDGWPGTVIVVTHDRYFLERVSDVTYALTGGGRCDLLPGGVDQYLSDRAGDRAARKAPTAKSPAATGAGKGESPAARQRRIAKELTRIEGQLSKIDGQIAALHEAMAAAASDHVRLAELNTELGELQRRKTRLEEDWLITADG